VILVSAKNSVAINDLNRSPKRGYGLSTADRGRFFVRRRHIEALNKANAAFKPGDEQLHGYGRESTGPKNLKEAQQP